MRKAYIYNSLSIKCNLRAEELEDKMIHKYAIKLNNGDMDR